MLRHRSEFFGLVVGKQTVKVAFFRGDVLESVFQRCRIVKPGHRVELLTINCDNHELSIPD